MSLDVESVALRSGTTAEWSASGLILGVGELGIDLTSNAIKVGDGVSSFADLSPTGGGGVSPDTLYFDTSEGFEVPDSGSATTVVFTTLPDGVTIDENGAYVMPPGLYLVEYQFTFNEAPAEDRSARVRIGAYLNPFVLLAGATAGFGYGLQGQFVHLVRSDFPQLPVSLAAVSPLQGEDPLTCDFAYMELRKIADAPA